MLLYNISEDSEEQDEIWESIESLGSKTDNLWKKTQGKEWYILHYEICGWYPENPNKMIPVAEK